MPRRIFIITSKKDANKKIVLNSLSYYEALEEALEELGWAISEDCDEVYKQGDFASDPLMAVWHQRSEYSKILNLDEDTTSSL
jgi:hypothetical protein